MRPWRTGTSSGTRDSDWTRSSPIGSLDAGAERSRWDASGACRRAALPAATLCSRAGCPPGPGVSRPPVSGEAGLVRAATYRTLAPQLRWRPPAGDLEFVADGHDGVNMAASVRLPCCLGQLLTTKRS